MATPTDTPLTREHLATLKTSQLWRLFTKAGLGVTRSKDRGWLIAKLADTPETEPTANPEEAPSEPLEAPDSAQGAPDAPGPGQEACRA